MLTVFVIAVRRNFIFTTNFATSYVCKYKIETNDINETSGIFIFLNF